MRSVNVLGFGFVDFPDSMSDKEIRQALERLRRERQFERPAKAPGTVNLSGLRREPGTLDLSSLRLQPQPQPDEPPAAPTAVTRESLERRRRQAIEAGGLNPEVERNPSLVDRIAGGARVAGEFVRGIPARIMESEVGMVSLPGRVAEGVARGVGQEVRDFTAGDFNREPLEGFRHGFGEAWRDSPAGVGKAGIRNVVVEPARDRLLNAAVDADFMGTGDAAVLDTAQLLAGEAGNPGNYVGLEMLRGAGMASRGPSSGVAARIADLEARGGAHALDEAGIAVREYGRKAAASELAQARAARSGEFLPGVREPLIYHDANLPSPGWKGRIPDRIKEIRDEPWREYYGNFMDRPTSPEPRPRSVNREPLPVKLVGGNDVERDRVWGLWGYASRRYPTLAGRVKELRIRGVDEKGVFFEPTTGVIQLAPDSDLGTLMHEITHVAQDARGRFQDEAGNYLGKMTHAEEPYAIRAGDVYSRIPQPRPRTAPPTDTPIDFGQLRDDALRRADSAIEQVRGLPEPSFAPARPRDTALPTGEGLGSGLIERSLPRAYTPDELAEFSRGGFRTTEEQARGLGMRATPEDGVELARQSLPIGELSPEHPLTWETFEDTSRRTQHLADDPFYQAPPGYTVRAASRGVEVTTPSGGSRYFESPRDAAHWLGAENDRLLAQEMPVIAEGAQQRLDSINAEVGNYYAQQDALRNELEWRTEAAGILEEELGRRPTRAEVDAEVGRMLDAVGRREIDDTSRYAVPPQQPPGEPRRQDLAEITVQTPKWASSAEDGFARLGQFADENKGAVLSPDDLPFSLDRLPLIRWERVESALNPRREGGQFWLIGDSLEYNRPASDPGAAMDPSFDVGGHLPQTATFEPRNPLVVSRPAFGTRAQIRGVPVGVVEGEFFKQAQAAGHDAVVMIYRNPQAFGQEATAVEVVTFPGAKLGPRQISPASVRDMMHDGVAPEVIESLRPGPETAELRALYQRVYDNPDSADPADLDAWAQFMEAHKADKRVSDSVSRVAGFTNWPRRGAGRVEPPHDTARYAVPPQQPVRLPEEVVAERMGWKRPEGSPVAVGPSLQLPEFQTNIAAQLGGDEMLAQWIVEHSDEVHRAIGPPQSWDTLEELATMAGSTKEELMSAGSHWNVLSPELRLRLLYVAKGEREKLAGLQAKLVGGQATDADKAEVLRLIDAQGDFIRLAAKTGSGYGRALNSLRMEARLALDDSQLLRQQLYRQYADQIDADKPILDALAKLDPQNPEELQVFLRHVNRPRFREYLQEYWVGSILSNPASHERNLIGNTVNALMENGVIRPLAAGFDAHRVRIERGHGLASEREVFAREAPAAMVGLTLGVRKGLERGWEVLRRGYDPTSMMGKLYPVRSAFARSQNRFVREMVGPVVTMPLRLLSASDALFKTMNHTAEIYALAARAASKEGLQGDAFAARVASLASNPTDEMVEAADRFALKATFNDEASFVGKAIINLRDAPSAQSTNPVGRFGIESYRATAGFILPFVKIADRLMVRGLEYTPIGAVKAIGKYAAKDMVGYADLAARSAIGSTLMVYGASLAMEGRLTAGAPTDPAERAAFYAANKQPWSFRTDDGTWIPYGNLQPIAMPLALVAAAWKGWSEHGDAPNAEKLGHAASEMAVYVTDQSYMDALSKFMNAVQGRESERGRAFSDLASNTAWGFAPYSGLTRAVAKGIDPRVIDTRTIADRVKQNVPGVSLSMRAKLTPWGEEVVPVGGSRRSYLASGSIIAPSTEIQGSVEQFNQSPPVGWGDPSTNNRAEQVAMDAELARLGKPLGVVGQTLSDNLPEEPEFNPRKETDWLDDELERLGRPLGYVDAQVSGQYGNGRSRGQWKLDPEEWHLYQQTAGRTTARLLERLFTRAEYSTWNIETQRDRVEKVIGAAREYARMWAVRYHRGSRPMTGTEGAAP